MPEAGVDLLARHQVTHTRTQFLALSYAPACSLRPPIVRGPLRILSGKRVKQPVRASSPLSFACGLRDPCDS